MAIPNFYLPMWMTRIASGIIGTFVALLIGSYGVDYFGGSARALLIVSLGSVAFGVIAAIYAHRFSFTNNIAGDMGYDGLEERAEGQDETRETETKNA